MKQKDSWGSEFMNDVIENQLTKDDLIQKYLIRNNLIKVNPISNI
jgi:hypothetical protein